MKKLLKFIGLLLLTAIGIGLIVIFEIKDWPVGSSFGGLLSGIILGPLWSSIQDFSDTTNWKASQRKLERGGIISKDTKVRISFAYLFRIKIDGQYFLVKNARGTGKFQPVGGVYKLKNGESSYLRQKFSAEDDSKIPVDQSSKGDYRLWIKDKYLRKFVRRFNKTEKRESVANLSREFKEELIDTGILDRTAFNGISYLFCGRHFTELKYGEHFQCYELLMADVVEIQLTDIQEQFLRNLMLNPSEQYSFVSEEDIETLGVQAGSDNLVESIGDHTKKILISHSEELLPLKHTGEYFKVSL